MLFLESVFLGFGPLGSTFITLALAMLLVTPEFQHRPGYDDNSDG